jgi:hypothetical protein
VSSRFHTFSGSSLSVATSELRPSEILAKYMALPLNPSSLSHLITKS